METRNADQQKLMDLIEEVKVKFRFLNKDVEKILGVGKNSVSTWKGTIPKRWVNPAKAPEYIKKLEDYMANPTQLNNRNIKRTPKKVTTKIKLDNKPEENIVVEPEIKIEPEIATTIEPITEEKVTVVNNDNVETTMSKLLSKKNLLLELIQIKKKQIANMENQVSGIDNAIEALSETF